jgi:hypothetical protein
MLKSAITVELPHVVADRHKTAGEWIRGLFGAKLDLSGDHEELTISALSLVAGLVEGFAAAGVKDVISFIVDKKVVYMDTNEVDDDLSLLLAAGEQKGILGKRFSEMHLVLSHREAGLHVLVDVRIHNRVLLGEEQMGVVLSARVEELRVQPGESAADYRARIDAFMADTARTNTDRLALDGLTRRIADKLGRALVGARTTAHPAIVQIIRPDAPQLARFRRLPFGGEVEAPRYRAVPTYQRAGAYADPFYYYYYDPYYDFMNWAMLDSMMHNAYWQSPAVLVVNPAGDALGTGDHLATVTDRWAGRDAVTFDGGGTVAVSDSIPDYDASTSPGWSAGDASAGGGDWGGADASGGDSSSSDGGSSDGGSSSSCGSSCSSGSSCGSSCGGGCGS